MQRIGILGGTFNPIHRGHLLLAETALRQSQLNHIIWVPTYFPGHKSRNFLVEFLHRVEMVKLAIACQPQFSLAPDLSQPNFQSNIQPNAQPNAQLNTQPNTEDMPQTQAVGGFSYGVDIFERLRSHHPQAEWAWILGLDTFQTLPHWYRRREFVAEINWIVAPRWLPEKGENLSLSPDETQNSKFKIQSSKLRLPKSGRELENSKFNPPAAIDLCQAVVEKLAIESIPVRWQLLSMPCIEISSSLVRQYYGDPYCGDRRSIDSLVPAAVATYIEQHNLYPANPSA